MLEAYVTGVSTRMGRVCCRRAWDGLVEQLGVNGMTNDRVSALCDAVR